MLTQFQSHTLNSHLTSAYPPVRFGGPDHQAWVDVLAAQQTVTEKDWCDGSGGFVGLLFGGVTSEICLLQPSGIASSSTAHRPALVPPRKCMVTFHPPTRPAPAAAGTRALQTPCGATSMS